MFFGVSSGKISDKISAKIFYDFMDIWLVKGIHYRIQTDAIIRSSKFRNWPLM